MIATLLALLFVGAPSAGPDVVLEDYVVQPGDSCFKISRRRFGKGKLYSIIHKHNELGPTPHKLAAGSILRLPAAAPVQPDAELTRTQRKVQARPAKDGAWSKALEGLDLFRGWRVNTLERAFAEVTFRDSTQIHLRENTLVIIYGDTKANTRRKTTTAKLDRGALRASLGALSGKSKSKVNVETPSAVTTLEGGVALVTVDEASTSRVANHGHGDAVVVSKTKRRKRVKVRRGMGSKVEKGREPTPPKPLPATPVWTAGSPTVFVVPAGGGGTLRGSWSAVEAADSYRVEIGQDKRGGFVSTAVVVPGDITQLEAHNLAPGKYFAIVSAIDDDAFESIPSRMLHAELRETALVGTGGAPIAIPAATEEPTVPKPIPLLVGTALTAPAGLQCAFGNGELSTAPIAMAVGEQVVACQDEAGRAVPGFSVVVQALKVAPSVGGTKGITLALGEAAALTLQLSSPAGVPKTLRIDAPSGVTVSDLDLDDQGKLTASVTASAKAPRTGELRLVSGTGEDKVTLGVASFTVAVAGEGPAAELANGEKSDPWIKRHAPTRNLVEIGVFGGVFFPHPQLELFEFTLDREDFGYQKQQSVALITGPRVSFAPLRFLAFEFDGAVIPSSAGGDRTTMWVARGQLLGQVGLWNTTPYVLAGFGAFGVASDRDAVGNDVDGAFHYGGGLKFFVSRRVMLRFEARDTLSSQRGIADGVAHSIELTAGLGFTLNRR